MLFWMEDLLSVIIYEVTLSYTGNGMIFNTTIGNI